MKTNNDIIYSIISVLDTTASVKQFKEVDKILIQSTISIAAAKVFVEQIKKQSHANDCCYFNSGDGWHRNCSCERNNALALAEELNLTTEKGGE